MKKIALALVLVLAPAAPAYASHERPRCSGEQREGNCNHREEEYGDGSCKYVCPAFDKSPVQDSFNIQICVQPGSCSPEKKDPPPSEAEPQSVGCLVPFPYHCDPKPN